MKNLKLSLSFLIMVLLESSLHAIDTIDHLQGEMSGEVTHSTVILQSRLTANTVSSDGDVQGREGIGIFEFATNPGFKNSQTTEWFKAIPENDYIIKTKLRNLKSGTKYYYRLWFGKHSGSVEKGRTCSFKTLQGNKGSDTVSFVVTTGMNYDKFYFGKDGNGKKKYVGKDKPLGFPALESILKLKPDYFIGTGDNVYYDFARTYKKPAKTPAELRKKWHEQFVKKRFVDLFATTATYWEKDDHDYRANDFDPYNKGEPSHELGIKMFLEQVPVVDLKEPKPKTYRTRRVNRHLQLWFVEGRDYRSSNTMQDGPDKTIWGKEQLVWLKRTLLESDATFKILVSPTPMVGPDRNSKIDNHANLNGFRHEGDSFFDWLAENGFPKKHFYILCGDRHWQYHAKHPVGIEEFSCGALVDANSMLGNYPGQKGSTDPEGKVRQYYSQTEPSGGFLRCEVSENQKGKTASMKFEFFDEKGIMLYQNTKIESLK
jgi:alkaline phosphatase D